MDQNTKTILVTSSDKNEGKTTTVSNLAVSFANLNKKVLIIDCDLRNPSIHKIKMKAKGGLWMILEVTGKRKERNGKDGIRGLQVKYRRVTVKDTKERFG